MKEEPRGPCGSWGPDPGSQLLHIKEEPEEVLPFAPVWVKSEDDEDKSSVLHQRPTEEKREETNVWECGAEAGCSSDPLTQFHSDSEEHTDSSEDTDHSQDYSQEQAPAKRRSYAMVPPDSAHLRDARPHRCPECGRSFKLTSHLKRHMLSHSGEKPHECSVCEKSFIDKGPLRKHLRYVHHMCPVCEVCFPDEMNLKEHLKTHEEDGTLDQSILKPFSCSECGKTFRQKSQLQRHMFSHTGEKPHECPECGKKFTRKSDVKPHMFSHTGERPHKCSVCEKRFIEKGTLTYHLRSKHHMCPVCEVCFPDDVNLKEHLKSHVEEGTVDQSVLKTHSCTECGKEFNKSQCLKTHMLGHTGEKPFSCTECGKSFRRRPQLQEHRFSHFGEKPHECPECGKRFTRRSQVQQHMFVHSREQPHQCPKCGTRFKRKSCLHHHALHLHPVCSVCQREFTDKTGLKEHLRTHVRDGTLDRSVLESHKQKPKCSICDSCFCDKSALNRHLRDHHHICPVCEEGFPDKTRLMEHLRSHVRDGTAERSVLKSCAECGKEFTSVKKLKQHMWVHSQERPYRCSVCQKGFKNKYALKAHMSVHTGKA